MKDSFSISVYGDELITLAKCLSTNDIIDGLLTKINKLEERIKQQDALLDKQAARLRHVGKPCPECGKATNENNCCPDCKMVYGRRGWRMLGEYDT